MTLVTTQMSLSLDGCYAGPEQEDMSDWIHGTEAGGFMRVTRWVINAMGWRERQGYEGGERDTNSQILEEQFAEAGAYVMGRRMFDGGELPWGEEPPFRAPVFVVTHREREPLERKGGTTFTFVTDGVESAVAQASPAQLREELDRLAEAGATDIVLHPCSAAPDQLTRIADAVGDPARQAGLG